jgi:putative ABC transport system permease protein
VHYSGTSLAWRAIRWRLGSSLVFLAVGIAAIAVASAAPIYLASAEQSLLNAQLGGELVTTTGVSIVPVPGAAPLSTTQLEALASSIPGGAGAGKAFETPLLQQTDSAQLFDPHSALDDGITFMYRTGECAQLQIVQGTCPSQLGQVLLSTRTATELGLHVGSRVVPDAGGRRNPPLAGVPAMHVSGMYVVPAALGSYWWDQNVFGFGTDAGKSELVDDGFVTLPESQVLTRTMEHADLVQVPLTPYKTTASTLPAFGNQLAAFQAQLASERISATTGLFTVFKAVSTQESQTQGVVEVIGLELVLLALMVLYGVAAGTGAERGQDMTVAELRGLRRRSMAVMALREPAFLLALAAPMGLLLGWLVIRAVATHVFGSHTPVGVDSFAVASVIGTFVAGLTASALGVRGLIRPSLVNESRTSAAKRAARAATLLDLLVLALAVVAIIQVVTAKTLSGGLNGSAASASSGATSNPLATFSPALVALAAGIAGARLMPLVVRAVARSVRWNRRVGTSLACASIMRRPGMARRVLTPAIAVGLLVFSIASFEVARANRTVQARFSTGAAVVDTVKLGTAVNLVAAVRQADPGGHEAMAADVVNTPSGTTLALDASRLAAVEAWPAGISSVTAAQVARYLAPVTLPPLMVSGSTAIRFRIDLQRKVSPPPSLELQFFDEASSNEDEIEVPAVTAGRHEYTVDFAGACSRACRFDNITAFWQPPVTSSVSGVDLPMVFSGLQERTASGWLVLASGFSSVDDWIGNTSAVTVSAEGGGLFADSNLNLSAQPPMLQRNDVPRQLPAVVTTDIVGSDTDIADPNQYPAIGLDGSGITVVSHITATALPQVGANATLVDLTLAQRAQLGAPAGVYEIWFHRPPSDSLLAKLKSEGVTIATSRTAAAAAGLLDHSGPALAFELFLLAAIAAVLLALGALVFAIASTSRQRAVEIAALAAAGVPRKTLHRSFVVEYAAVVLAGVVLGVVSGIVTVHLVLSALPEFTPGRSGPNFGVFVPWEHVLLAAGGALIILVIGTTLASSMVMRRATPVCLRVSQ